MTRLTHLVGVLTGTAVLTLIFATGFSTAVPPQSPPPPSAPSSAWQTWAGSEQSYMQSTRWGPVLQSMLGPSQQLVHWSLVTTTSTGAGVIPAGITTDSLWFSATLPRKGAGIVSNRPMFSP